MWPFVSSLYLFATEGRGTLTPWDPPGRLVVRGPYRFVRNPMISSVLLIIIAEALYFRSPAITIGAAAFFLINAIYLPLVEERGLERRFGEEYRAYKHKVPRLIPSLRGLRREASRRANSS